MANYLGRAGEAPIEILAHRLAAGAIFHLAGMAGALPVTLRALAAELRAAGNLAPPATVAEVAAVVERVDGVRFAALVDALCPDRDSADRALAEILAAAHILPESDDFITQRHFEMWEPIVAAVVDAAHALPAGEGSVTQRHLEMWKPPVADVVAAGHGDVPADTVAEGLGRLANSADWGALVGVLRPILAGERVDDHEIPQL
jgi:hypothetical protein